MYRKVPAVWLFFTLISGSSLVAQNVAVVQNFPSAEIDSLVHYLSEIDVPEIRVFNQDELHTDSLSGYDLVIWDDLSYASGGITDTNVFVFHELYESGHPLYFIGDDLPYAVFTNLGAAADTLWTELLHMTASANISGASTIVITDTIHPIINGPYGRVVDFLAYIDPDIAAASGTGENLLAITNNGYAVLTAFQDSISGTRLVTQNTLAYRPGDPAGQQERERLFKNAVIWLLEDIETGLAETAATPPSYFHLGQNYPNPFNPVTYIPFTVARPGFVSLEVHNILGWKVADLVKGNLSAGSHRVRFNGSGFASGIYYYSLHAGSGKSVKRMILLR